MDLDRLVAFLIPLVLGLVGAFAIIIGSAVILSWGDRKVLGFTQDRYGPQHTGKWGLLQPIADTLKLVLKEDVVPAEADKILHLVAPIVFVMPTVAAFVVLPLGDGLVTADLNIGVLYIVAISSLGVIGVLSAGWSGNNKYGVIGGFRSVAQMISYEVPLLLALVPAVMLAGTLQVSGIVRAQDPLWFGLFMPLGLLIYFICGLAETNRAPFDLPEAESELVAGYLTEYSGVRWAMFFMAEYGNMVVICAVASAVFLGGWQGPLLPGPVWMLGKTYALIFLFLWVRATLPRLRIDELMSFSWKALIPLTLINIAVVGVAATLWPDAYVVPVGIANWLLVLAFTLLLPRWLSRRQSAPRSQAVPATVSVRAQAPERSLRFEPLPDGDGNLAAADRRS